MSPLIVRKENVICTACGCVEPINAGDGTPLDTFIQALTLAEKRHSRKNHANPFGEKLK